MWRQKCNLLYFNNQYIVSPHQIVFKIYGIKIVVDHWRQPVTSNNIVICKTYATLMKILVSLMYMELLNNPHARPAYQSGTLWYLGIIFLSLTIFGSITKNGMSFVPRMEMLLPKMTTVTFKLLYFLVRWIIWDNRFYTGWSSPRLTMVTIAPHSFFGKRHWNKVFKISPSRIHCWRCRFLKWRPPAATN